MSRGECNWNNAVKYVRETHFPSDKAAALGYALRTVPRNRIQDAIANHGVHGSFQLALIDIFQYWLDNELHPEWEKLAKVFDAGFAAVANRIRGCSGKPSKPGEIMAVLMGIGFAPDDGVSLAPGLGVPHGKLQTIMAERGVIRKTELALADILKAWFDNDLAPSWKKLEKALDEVDPKKLREKKSQEIKEAGEPEDQQDGGFATLLGATSHGNEPDSSASIGGATSYGNEPDGSTTIGGATSHGNEPDSSASIGDDSKESKSGPEEKDKTGKQYSWLWTACIPGILLAIVVVVSIFGALFLYGLPQNGFPLNGKPFQDPSNSTHHQEDPAKGICTPDKTDPREKFLQITSQKKSEITRAPKPTSESEQDVIKFADWDTKYDLPSETYFGLNFAEIHRMGIKGDGVKLAIIDECNTEYVEGIFEDHEALQTNSSCKIHSVKLDCSSHTTRHALTCASIAVGEPIHVARYHDDKEKKIVEVKYPGGIAPEASTTLFLINAHNRSSVLDALDHVIKGSFDILSMSFVYYKQDHDFEQRLDQLKGKTVVVAAAGNRGNRDKVGFPARHADVISVGSLDIYFGVSKYSAKNKGVDLYYPGEIMSAIDQTTTTLKFSAGTSVSTPGVAGVVCLLVEIASHHKCKDEIKEKKKVLSLLKHVVTTDKHGYGTIVYDHNTSFLKQAYDDKNYFIEAMIDLFDKPVM